MRGSSGATTNTSGIMSVEASSASRPKLST
jgi:hypothetical protein